MVQPWGPGQAFMSSVKLWDQEAARLRDAGGDCKLCRGGTECLESPEQSYMGDRKGKLRAVTSFNKQCWAVDRKSVV